MGLLKLDFLKIYFQLKFSAFTVFRANFKLLLISQKCLEIGLIILEPYIDLL